MDPNGSQYNILIRVVAAQARREIAKLKAELAAINAQMAKGAKGGAATSTGPVAAAMRASASATTAATSSATAYANAMKSAGGASATASASTDKLAAAIARARIAEIKLAEVRMQGAKASSTQVAADARLSAARNAAATAAARASVAEMRLAEVQAKKSVSASTLAAAEARVASTRAAALVSTQRVAIAEMALAEAKAKGTASASTVAAAEERLILARRGVTGATAAATTAQTGLTAAQTAGAAAESRLAATSTLNRMRTLGATTVWAGKQVSMFFTAPLLLAGAAAFKWQMDNEKAAAQLVKVYDNTSKEAAAAIQGIGGKFEGSPVDNFFKALSEKMGIAKAEITEMGAAWAAVGATGKQLTNLTRITSEAMVLGDLDQVEATEALIAIQAQYKLSSSDLEKTLWTLNATENATGASMGDLIKAYSQTAAVARSAGIDQAHLAAMISALVPATGSAAKAGNGLKSIISKFADPDTEKATTAFEQLALSAGMAGDAFLNAQFKSKNMTERLEQIADVYGHLTGQAKVEFAKRVGGIFQISRAEQLLGDIFERNGDKLSYYGTALKNNNDAFQENSKATKTFRTYQNELNTVLQSNPKKFQQVGQVLKNSMTDVIIPLIPHILWLAKGVASLARAFSELNPTLQKWIVIALLAVALIGPISSLIGGFVLLAATVGKAFAGLGRVLARLLFHFLGIRTGMYKTNAEMARSTPFIKKLGNMWKWLFGTKAAGDAATTASTAAAQASQTALTAAGQTAQATATTTSQAAQTAATVSGQSAQLLAIEAGQVAQSRVFAVNQAGIVTIVTGGQAAQQAALVAGQSSQLLALTAGQAAQGRVFMASQAGIITALRASTAAQLAIVSANQAAIGGVWVASQAGQIAAISSSRALIVAAESATQAALFNVVRTGSSSMGRVFIATQMGHIAIINAARPEIVAAQAATNAALVAATRTGQSAQLATITAGQGAIVAASGAGGAAAAGAAAGGATKAASAKKSGVIASLVGMFAFIPGLGKYLAKAGTFLKGMLPKVFSVGGLRAAVSGSKIVGLFTGPIGWAIAAAITLIAMFPKQIVAALKAAWDKIWAIAGPIMGDSDIPILARPFVAAVEVIKQALVALPKIVVAVFKSVVSVIQAAARAVYNAFSYINPFAHHSPSLVENVTEGMAIVTNEFADADKSIQGSMRNAYAAINRFGSATAGLNMDVQSREREEKRANIASIDPGALGSWDEMVSIEAELERQLEQTNYQVKAQEAAVESAQDAVDAFDAQLDSMSDTLENYQDQIDAMGDVLDALQEAADFAADKLAEAEEKLDKFANAPIKGMRAMEDQIFANEMAQKKLQLALLDMGGEGIDDAVDKFAMLQGQIETLSGQRNELRMGGAGSDILSVYDDQIAAIQAQQQAVDESLGPIQDMENELKRLKTEAERLDLEKSLAFDPLQRQIAQLADTTEELTFDQITNGIRSARAEISVWSTMVDGANASVDAQQAAIDGVTAAMEAYQDQIDAVETQREAAQANVDLEQEKLDLVKETYDQLDQTIQDLKTSMDEYNQSIDTTIQRHEEEARAAEEAARAAEQAAKDAKEAQDELLGGGAEDFGLPGGSFQLGEELDLASIEDQTKALTDEVEKAFGDIDLLSPFKNAWQAVKDFFGRVWDDYIWPGLIHIKDNFLTWIADLPGQLMSAISYSIGFIIGAIGRILWEAISTTLDFALWLTEKFMQALDAVTAWATNLENWKNLAVSLWNGCQKALQWIFSGDALIDLATFGAQIIGGLLMGILGAIKGIGTWLWDNVLVPFFNGIKDGFDMHSPSRKMAEFGVDIIMGLLNGIVDTIGGVITFFSELGGKVIEAAGDIGAKLVEWMKAGWNWLRDKMPENVQGFMDWIAGIAGRIVEKLGNGKDALFDFGKNLVQGLLDGAGSLLSKIGEFFLDKLPGWIKEPFKKALGIQSPSKVFAGYGKNVGQGLVGGLDEMLPQVEAATLAMADAVASTQVNAPALQVPLTTAPELLKVQSPTVDVPSQVAADTAIAQQSWNDFGTVMAEMTTVLNDAMSIQIDDLSANTQYQFELASVNSQGTVLQMKDGVLSSATAMQDGMTATATLMRDNVVNLATSMTDQVTTQLTQLKDQGVSAMQGTNDGVTTEFQAMSDNLNSIFTDQIQPMFNEFQPMLTTAEGWFKDSVNNIGTQWGGIQEKVAEPSRFVVNKVYNEGVRGAWNKVNTWLGLPALDEYVAKFEAGGVVGRDTLRNATAAKNITRGGKLTGYGTGDSTLFAGQGGEFVVPRKMAKSIGYDTLEAARRASLSGKSTEGMGSVLGFQQGGTVPGAVLDTEKMLLQHARGQKYVYGGTGPDGFDCSGIASAVWNSLTGQPNLWSRAFDTEVNFAKYGYERGLNGWATIGVHNGGGGPNSHMAGTLNGKNYESGGAHNSTAYGGPAAGSDHPQFEHGYTLKEVGGIFESGGMGGAGVPSMVSRVMEVWKQVMDPIGALAGNGSPLVNIAKPGFDKYNLAGGDFLKGKASEWDAANRASSGGFGGIGSGVEVWRSTVQEVLRDLGYPLSWDELTLAQMQTESGGNQFALNDWDSNWQKGTPSKGLMQVIDPTFAAYRWPGYLNDIWDPKANIAAGLRWVMTKGGPEAQWGRGHGYDSGGWLQPGTTTAVNLTGKPEAVLTNEDWNAIYEAANNPLDVEGVAQGVETGMKRTFGYNAVENLSQEQAERAAAELNETQSGWQQNIYDETKSQTGAVNDTTKAVKATEKGIDNVAKVTSQVSSGVDKLSTIMLAVANAMTSAANGQGVTFGMIAPIIDGVADLIEMLPDVEATYVPWAGFDVVETEEMKRQKAANDAANAAKGSYMVAKTVLPGILRSVSTIGTAIENLIAQDGAAWTSAIALLSTGNPMGAILIIALAVKAIFTILPLILKAIVDIVPNLIKAIIKFLTDFAPDATYSYDSIDDATNAVKQNEADIKSGVYQQQWEGPNIDAPVNQSTTMNFYGDIVLPNITSGDQAEEFSENLQNLSEG